LIRILGCRIRAPEFHAFDSWNCRGAADSDLVRVYALLVEAMNLLEIYGDFTIRLKEFHGAHATWNASPETV
jgi:hypothetical protein